jgi:hypothetical protein
VLLRDYDWTCYLPVNRCFRRRLYIEDGEKINLKEGLLWVCEEVSGLELGVFGSVFEDRGVWS